MRFKWSDGQLNFLKENYPIYGGKFCRLKLGLTKNQIKKKVSSVGIIKNETINGKVCPKCLRLKPLSEYSKNRCSSSGLASRCKECSAKIMESYRIKNPEKYRKICRNSSKKMHKLKKNNLQYKLSKRFRSRVYYALRCQTLFIIKIVLFSWGDFYVAGIIVARSYLRREKEWESLIKSIGYCWWFR